MKTSSFPSAEPLRHSGELRSYKEISVCRSCKSSNIIDLFSLGDQWLTDFPDPGYERDGIVMPLALMLCQDCEFVQLKNTVDQNAIYGRPMYWYKSGINNTMKLALKDVVNKAQQVVPLKDGDKIIDIGSNDGTLARMYPEYVKKIGFEPSYNVWDESNDNLWYKSFNDYFSYKGEVAKIITSCAMFYDLDDPSQFLQDIRASLDINGIWIDQQNYLTTMLENLTFDNISHEHLGYYSFKAFENLLNRHELEIIDVEVNGVNGGSFRSYIRRKPSAVNPLPGAAERIAAIRAREDAMELNTRKPYDLFYNHAINIRSKLNLFITGEKARGKSIWVYGASTRGQVILQYCGLDKTLIDGCSERNPDKYGKVTIGTGIPITDEETARKAKPDYFLVLPYSFKNEFLVREAAFLESGGAFIFPLPEVEIVNKDRRFTL